jgi:hypothetical protein
LWCVERKEQCADAEGFAKGVPNAIAAFGLKAKQEAALQRDAEIWSKAAKCGR